MTPQAVLSAAKQGNPQAIAALMNRSLQPKGITAKAKLTDGCLHVMLEGLSSLESFCCFLDSVSKAIDFFEIISLTY